MKRIKNNGFTLIEILVSLAILGIVLAGIYSVYTMQHKSYIVQEQVAEMQQNERIALQMITRDIRMAGLGLTCSYGGILFTEDADGNGALNDGEDIDGNGALSAFGNGLGFDGSDTVAIAYYIVDPRGNAGGNTYTASDFDPAAATFTVDNADGFSSGDLILISNTNPRDDDDCHYAAVYATAVDSGANTITHDSAKAVENQPGGIGLAFKANSNKIRRAAKNEGGRIAYFINGSYQLIRSVNGNAQPLADNIEDMQIAYGIDINNNGIVVDGKFGTVPGGEWFDSPAGQDMALLREIRVTLVARTTREDPAYNIGVRPVVEGHDPACCSAATTPAQAAKYRRRVLQSTIKLRNIKGTVAIF